MPVAYTLGVEWEDSLHVGELLGVKVAINELLSYLSLGKLNMNGVISVSL